MDSTVYVAKKALISCAVTKKLICIFVFAYAKCRFSHDEAQFDFPFLVIVFSQSTCSCNKILEVRVGYFKLDTL